MDLFPAAVGQQQRQARIAQGCDQHRRGLMLRLISRDHQANHDRQCCHQRDGEESWPVGRQKLQQQRCDLDQQDREHHQQQPAGQPIQGPLQPVGDPGAPVPQRQPDHQRQHLHPAHLESDVVRSRDPAFHAKRVAKHQLQHGHRENGGAGRSHLTQGRQLMVGASFLHPAHRQGSTGADRHQGDAVADRG